MKESKGKNKLFYEVLSSDSDWMKEWRNEVADVTEMYVRVKGARDMNKEIY